ncbi:hypothetical protein E2C01_039891 [Portunus trituberculatus]|uniref:Uncharacterized protein n=1 Tax=Portunus trituberculatus TaxID=210409 RepID=A0A5B7FFY4_PORTR|nr:hypothetical protein [Portunus trituberculatus]
MHPWVRTAGEARPPSPAGSPPIISVFFPYYLQIIVILIPLQSQLVSRFSSSSSSSSSYCCCCCLSWRFLVPFPNRRRGNPRQKLLPAWSRGRYRCSLIPGPAAQGGPKPPQTLPLKRDSRTPNPPTTTTLAILTVPPLPASLLLRRHEIKPGMCLAASQRHVVPLAGRHGGMVDEALNVAPRVGNAAGQKAADDTIMAPTL